MKFIKIAYSDLNARQKENYNYQKISAVLADYGYVTFRLSDDWNGADFIALHNDGEVLRVQLKARLTFNNKYVNRELYVAFPDTDSNDWFVFPHDDLLDRFLTSTNIGESESWKTLGGYSFPSLSKSNREMLEPYRMSGTLHGIEG